MGWYTVAAATGGTEFTATTTVTAARTVYARWSKVINPGGIFDIGWVELGDLNVVISNVTVSVSDAGSIPFNITASPPAGYTVSRWMLDGDIVQNGGGTYNFSSTDIGTHTVDLYLVKNGSPYNFRITVRVTP
jgi:uncharacterized repeat protein (TIGR02543 family)